MQIKHKDIEINGRQFRIKKFSARTGSFIIVKMTTLLAPLLKGINPNVSASLDNIDIDSMIENLISLDISEKDFDYLQGKALQVCYELLPAGPAPVLNENGTFGVSDLEDDVAAVMSLTIQSLAFNLTSFFQGSGLSGFLGNLISSRQGS